jgi:hypothetical protein
MIEVEALANAAATPTRPPNTNDVGDDGALP